MKITNFKLGIGIPLSFPSIPSAFFDSFITLDTGPFVYLRSSAGPIDEMRNNIVKQALESQCSHLIMMDTDQVYDPTTIKRLLSHKLPVVGCLVYRRYPPFDPLMLRGDVSHYQTVAEWEPGELVEVDATGTGCLMFETSIFRKMPMPWFRFRTSEDGSVVGEDIGLCSDLRAAGYKIYVDTSIPCGHLSQMVINEGTWKLYNHVKEAELKKVHDVEHGVLKTIAA